MSLHVLSYNIHKGFSFQQKFVLGRIKEAIRTVKADLVFLQEVLGDHKGHSRKHENWPAEPLEYLAETLWPHFAYGKNAVYTEGHHGNAILSAHPFSFYENIDISTNRLERRGLLHGIVQMPDGSPALHVICVHLDLFERSRHQQIERLCQRIDDVVPHDSPLIIAGDFNDWRETISPVLEAKLDVIEVFKEKTGAHALSFPSWFPMLRLDRIYVRGLDIRETKVLKGPPWNTLSDHNALYSELTIAEKSK